MGDWNVKVRSLETPAVTDKFGLGVQNEARQRLIEFCQENAQFSSVQSLSRVRLFATP